MPDSKQVQEFFDNGQYSILGLKRYEWIFGETFLSTGGISTTTKVLRRALLCAKPRVLDIGSGLGGSTFVMAEQFNADVTGLDLSQNMMTMARAHLDKRPELKHQVSFEIKDCTKIEYPENTFDLVYSRDALMHVQNKDDLFKNIYKWLKPGGQVLFTDYVKGEDESKYSQEFRDYLKQRGYHMSKLSDYKRIMENSGFKNILIQDWRTEFRASLEMELKKLRDHKREFLSEFSQKDYSDLETGWMDKIERSERGFQSWVLVHASK